LGGFAVIQVQSDELVSRGYGLAGDAPSVGRGRHDVSWSKTKERQMQKITPFLWFDKQAEEAAKLYTSLFDNSKIVDTARYAEGGPLPEGTVMTVTFQLEGQEFMALNGGPEFTLSPAVSFFVNCETQQEIEGLWKTLRRDGVVFMELDKYPFSAQFGWVQDRFGVSWQLNLASRRQKIVPFLTYVGDQDGTAEAAMNDYTSLFRNSSITRIERYSAGENGYAGTVKHATFTLDGQEFMAMDTTREHSFTFTPALSFFVNCETQEEVDRLWDRLSEGGEKGVCGWLEDRYGVSWQIVPTVLGQLLHDEDREKAARVMKAMLQMTKLDIKALLEAYEQE
jgi:predicted 3-demethylubiquinone-9 3-methyltransferase (glyoxalase superfamily)